MEGNWRGTDRKQTGTNNWWQLMHEGKLNKGHEALTRIIIKNTGERLRPESEGRHTINLSLTHLPLSRFSTVGSDVVEPNYSRYIFLFLLPVCPLVFSHLPIFLLFRLPCISSASQTHRSWTPAFPIMSCKYQRLCPGILPTPAQQPASSEPISVLLKWSCCGNIPLHQGQTEKKMQFFRVVLCMI